MKLSQNFTSEEFQCPCCGGEVISGELAFKLQTLRDLIGKPVLILSGYRCQKFNREINGYPKSPHIGGLAADITADIDYKELALLAGKIFSRVGLYPLSKSKFIHVDVQDPRPSKAWVKEKDYTYFKTLKEALAYINESEGS